MNKISSLSLNYECTRLKLFDFGSFKPSSPLPTGDLFKDLEGDFA
jgi:hypothetical protein